MSIALTALIKGTDASRERIMRLEYTAGSTLVGALLREGEIVPITTTFSVDFNRNSNRIFAPKCPDLARQPRGGMDALTSRVELLIGDGASAVIDNLSFTVVHDANLGAGMQGEIALGPESELAALFPNIELEIDGSDVVLSSVDVGTDSNSGGTFLEVPTFAVGNSRFGFRAEYLKIGKFANIANAVVIFDPSIDAAIIPANWVGKTGIDFLGGRCDEFGNIDPRFYSLDISFGPEAEKIEISPNLLQYPAGVVATAGGMCQLRAVTWNRNEMVIGRQLLAAIEKMGINLSTGTMRMFKLQPSGDIRLVLPIPNLTLPIVRFPRIVKKDSGETVFEMKKVNLPFMSFLADRWSPGFVNHEPVFQVTLSEADPRAIMSMRITGLAQGDLFASLIDTHTTYFTGGTWVDSSRSILFPLFPLLSAVCPFMLRTETTESGLIIVKSTRANDSDLAENRLKRSGDGNGHVGEQDLVGLRNIRMKFSA